MSEQVWKILSSEPEPEAVKGAPLGQGPHPRKAQPRAPEAQGEVWCGPRCPPRFPPQIPPIDSQPTEGFLTFNIFVCFDSGCNCLSGHPG